MFLLLRLCGSRLEIHNSEVSKDVISRLSGTGDSQRDSRESIRESIRTKHSQLKTPSF